MTEYTATKADIERWLREAQQECRESDWQSVYRNGFLDGLTAVMCKMDDARRAACIDGESSQQKEETQ